MCPKKPKNIDLYKGYFGVWKVKSDEKYSNVLMSMICRKIINVMNECEKIVKKIWTIWKKCYNINCNKDEN